MSYCEHCEAEHEGLLCPDCGAEMLQEVDPASMPMEAGGWAVGAPGLSTWPLTPSGTPEPAVSVATCPDFLSHGGILTARLEAAGIPVLTSYPGAGEASKFYTGISNSGVELQVPASMAAQAKALLSPAGGDSQGEEI